MELLLPLVGLGLGAIQTIHIFILVGIRRDNANLWDRMNKHYHEIDCDNDACRHLRTGNVVIPGTH